jgi:hypothetical protein
VSAYEIRVVESPCYARTVVRVEEETECQREGGGGGHSTCKDTPAALPNSPLFLKVHCASASRGRDEWLARSIPGTSAMASPSSGANVRLRRMPNAHMKLCSAPAREPRE